MVSGLKARYYYENLQITQVAKINFFLQRFLFYDHCSWSIELHEPEPLCKRSVHKIWMWWAWMPPVWPPCFRLRCRFFINIIICRRSSSNLENTWRELSFRSIQRHEENSAQSFHVPKIIDSWKMVDLGQRYGHDWLHGLGEVDS